MEVQGILGVSGAEEIGHQTVAILPMCPSRASGWYPFQVTSIRLRRLPLNAKLSTTG